MKAHLRKQNRDHICLEQPPLKPPGDAAGNPVPLTQAQQRALAAEQKEYEDNMT